MVLHRLISFPTLLLLCGLYAPAAAQVKMGLDVLLERGDSALQSMRLGLITNATGVDANGKPNYERLLQAGFRIEALFAPEHGFQIREEAGQHIYTGKTSEQIPIYSLYGTTKKPTPEMLQNLDALLFDIQDIGTRCYTYISTMQLAMEACAAQGKLFVVLDRPNPIAPILPQGFMLDTAYRSFVGYVKVPLVHGLTAGELAQMIQSEELPHLRLRVVAMQNFRRQRFADEDSQFRLIPPSPNITSLHAMLLYPALVFLEGTNLSEGRGTDMPFEVFGAPFLDAEKVRSVLYEFKLSGVRFDTLSFMPKSLAGKSSRPKFRDRWCKGIRITITDRHAFQPFALGVAILLAIQRVHPKELQWVDGGKSLDRLAGTARLRELIEAHASLPTILAESQESLATYLRRWKTYWLYE
ncbi:MAG: DUF1343 domain-containing protein [Chloroherpetonaceae bacterium]|nr:DUF1343 domain-containing protein [Chloroherpetonaceae bacterium]